MSYDLSVVIVHYNTPDLLCQCLISLHSIPCAFSFETIVIDNASQSPGIAALWEEFPTVEFHFNPKNLGFARTCNQGIRMGQGRYLMLLNPDALIDGRGMAEMVEFMDAHPDTGISAPQLLNPDGSLQYSCRRFPSLRAILLRASRLDRLFPRPVAEYLMMEWDHDSAQAVDWVIGACMVLRQEALDSVGLLDEGFFMYYEDIDLCYRMKQGGWKVCYNPQVKIRHEHQRTSASLLPNRLSLVHAHSLCRLFRKHRLAWW